MKKFQILTILLVVFGLSISIMANNNSRHNSAVRFAANNREDDEHFKWQINIKVNDDVGVTGEKFAEDLEKAFKKEGDTIEEIASPDSTSLYIVIGKDDGDDNNDGEADDEDADKYGNGLNDADEKIVIHNLDEEYPEGMNAYPDDDKNAGVFISITDEYGNNDVYITKRDSLEPKTAAQAIAKTKNHYPSFIPASFSFVSNKSKFEDECERAVWSIRACMEGVARRKRAEEEARQKEQKQKEDEAILASTNWTTLLTSGKTFPKDTKITDPKSSSYFTYQFDGNIVIYNTSSKAVWASGSWEIWGDRIKFGNELRMQADGNLVAYNNENQVKWFSGTDKNPGAYLQIEWKLLRLRIVDKTGKPIKLL
ncbi:MAG TPA: hypothetical protein PKY82_31775 [Pyrinomonadaceae bacterium]|nr:hypothetical protein [Pyrinomonadaceae bacterium]